MRVYIVLCADLEGEFIESVFSDEKKAKKKNVQT